MTNRQSIPTSDEIWKILREVSAAQKETAQQMKETDKQIKETSREIKKAQNLFTTQWGRLMESLVEGDLVKLLNKRGIRIQRTSTNEKGMMSYIDEKGNKRREHCEIDIVAKNGREIVVVEVKTTLRMKDVNRFLDVLKRFTQLLPEYKGNQLYGAVAYLRSQDSAETYAEEKGLFVIKATGSSSSIINKKDFKPKFFHIHSV